MALLAGLIFASGLTYNVQYTETASGEFISVNSIYSFLEKLESGGYESIIYYDSKLNQATINNFSDYFNISAEKFSGTSQKSNLTIYIGNLNSGFINSEIRQLIGKEDYYGAVIFHEVGDKESLYLIVKDDSVLEWLLVDLEIYYYWSEELYYENLVYYSTEEGFSKSEAIPCNSEKETDLGDNSNIAGCLDNGADWMCDTCVNKSLVEFYCENNISFMKNHNCLGGCNDGACIGVGSCTRGYLNSFKCKYCFSYMGCSQPNSYALMQAYQSSVSGKCSISWKNLKTFSSKTLCESALANPSMYKRRTITAQVTAESNFSFLEKIADFFRNLF